MDLRKHNWALGLITVLAVVAILSGGQLLWQKYAVAKPLDKVFSEINGVEGTTWENSGNSEPVKVYVTLKNVDNLQKTYEGLVNGSQSILGKKTFKIIIKDSRTQELEEFYHSIHYHVYEAAYTGNFAVMAEKINEKASVVGVSVHTYVDASNIYVQASKNAADMYVVLPRTK